jgi:hypothetical protein
MTTKAAADLLTKPGHMSESGDALIAEGVVTLAAGDSDINDILRPCIIRAGTEVHALIVANDDMDSNGTPTAAWKVGFTPVSSNDGSLAADDDYFVAAADTTPQAANKGKVFALFAPIKFEQDVFLDFAFSAAAATEVAGAKLYAKVLGQAKGVK